MFRTIRPTLSASTQISRRHASTASSPIRRSLGTVALFGGSLAFAAYFYDSRSMIHEHVAIPLLQATLDAEQAHRLAIRMLGSSAWVRPRDKGVDDERLAATLWDKHLSNPVGIAAGFDKDAEAIDGLFDLGFGYVEVGSVTPEPQPGNPKPRFFRLLEDDACINRYGFNSAGHRQTLHRLQSRIKAFADAHPSLFPDYDPSNPLSGLRLLPPSGLPRSLRPGQLLAVNLGKNKTSSAESNEDYVKGVKLLGPYADILVINVSSPNTPGLRGLQGKDFLQKLLTDVTKERDALPGKQEEKAKVVVKIAPDLDEDEIADIARAVRGSGVEGVIVSNTTVKRDGLGLISANQHEVGGLSGAPVKPFALLALKTLRPLLPPSIPIIGCGGIQNGQDAIEYAQAGAAMIQAYTSFGYKGIGFPRKVKDEIVEALDVQGGSWKSIVKASQDKWSQGVQDLSKSLLGEVEKLETIKAGTDYTPWQDLVAERGMGGNVKEAKAIEFGSADASAPSSESPFAPPSASGENKGLLPAAGRQLSDFLGQASRVIGHPGSPSAAASSTPVIAATPSTSASAPSLSETVDLPTTAQAANQTQAPASPASLKESAHLNWVKEITKGERRMV